MTIYGDDEVDNVDEEHEGVDVAHRAVLRVDDVIEELPDGKVDVQSAVGTKNRETAHLDVLEV